MSQSELTEGMKQFIMNFLGVSLNDKCVPYVFLFILLNTIFHRAIIVFWKLENEIIKDKLLV